MLLTIALRSSDLLERRAVDAVLWFGHRAVKLMLLNALRILGAELEVRAPGNRDAFDGAEIEGHDLRTRHLSFRAARSPPGHDLETIRSVCRSKVTAARRPA